MSYNIHVLYLRLFDDYFFFFNLKFGAIFLLIEFCKLFLISKTWCKIKRIQGVFPG